MRAGLPARLLLLLAAVCLFVLGSPVVAATCLVPIAVTYVSVGERRLLFTYSRPILVLAVISAALWIIVYVDLSRPDLGSAMRRLVEPAAPFGVLVRMIAATTIIVLAIGSAPDGGDLALARSMGFGLSGAIVYAGAKSSIALVQESFGRSVVALRAHGAISARRLSWLARLPLILQLTWTSCLHMMVSRAEIKWERNGFLHAGAPVFERRASESRNHNAYCFFCAATVMLLVLGEAAWR